MSAAADVSGSAPGARVFLASRNRKKIDEMERILSAHLPGVQVVGIDDVEGYDEPVEDQPTFTGNALLKARAGVEATGLPSIADDSGICVDALGGAPGAFSAYWAGHRKDAVANVELLLDQLADIADPRRTAHFTSVIALVTPEGAEHVVEGIWPGRLATAPAGGGGFGYDPIFIPDDQTGPERTAAELSPEEKNAQSHRARAFAALTPLLRDL